LILYDSSEFRSAMPEGGLITGIAFRLDESIEQPLSVVLPDIEIRMATARRSPSDISFVFADNVGPDETIVFARGQAHLEASTSPDVPPPFTQFIPLTKAFAYDPGKGGLAVDLLTDQAVPGRILLDTGGSGTAAVVGPIGFERALGPLPGLIVELQFEAIPEATASRILAVGMFVFGLRTLHAGR
jgi:hypothetical protein